MHLGLNAEAWMIYGSDYSDDFSMFLSLGCQKSSWARRI